MRDETCNVRAARREDANEEGQTKIFAPGPTSSHLALADRSPRSLLPQTPALPLASVPPGALALGPAAAAEGEFQHAAPRLPT